jgi:ribosomal protein L14
MANERLEEARAAYQSNLKEPFQNLKAMGLMPKTGPLPEPESPQVPLAAAELVGFEQNFAPAVREVGLEATVQAIVNRFEGPGAYRELRGTGLNDLDIVKRYMNIEKVDLPIQSMRGQGLTQDEILTTFLDDLGLDENEDLLKKGISPQDFLSTFVKGRQLTPTEAAAEGTARGVTVGAPATAVMVTGATIGAPIAPPFGSIVLGGAGLILGSIIGTEAEEAIFPDEPILDSNTQALLEGTKVVGEGVTMMGAPKAFKTISDTALNSQAGFLNTLGQTIRLRSFNQEKNPVFQPGAMSETMRFLQSSDPVMFQFLRTYKDRPTAFQIGEGASVVGAGIGAGIAEQAAPGQFGPRILSEVIGGVSASPLTSLVYLTTAKDALQADAKEIAGQASQSTVESRVGAALRELLIARGEDPDAIQQQLRSPDFNDLLSDAAEKYDGTTRPLLEAADIPAPTSRSLTASSTLGLIEGRLRALNGRFGTDVQNQLDNQIQAVNNLITALTLTGGNNSIQAAAQIRNRHFSDLMNQRLDLALQDATKAVGSINPNDVTARNEASKRISSIIEGVFQDARAQEKQLYGQVPNNVIVGQDNLIATIQAEMAALPEEVAREVFPRAASATGARFAEQMQAAALDTRISTLQEIKNRAPAPGESFPRLTDQDRQNTGLGAFFEVDRALTQAQKDREKFGELNLEPPTYQQMLNYRSFLLSEARKAASGENPGMADARVYGVLADAIRQDLGDLENLQTLNPEISANDIAAADTARAFSKVFNDTFRRAFPNKALQNKATGADFVQPELLYRQIFQGQDDETMLRMREIDDAVRFLVNDATPGGLQKDQDALDAVLSRTGALEYNFDLVMRALADNPSVINPETGEVNTRAVAAFVKRNEGTLERLPQLKADLENSAATQVLLQQARSEAKEAERATAFGTAKLFEQLTGELPVSAIQNVLRSDAPEQGMKNLVTRLREGARRSEAGDAPEGMPKITLDAVDSELRDAVFEAARQFSQSDKDSITGIPDFAKLQTFFLSPRGKVPPLIKTLVDAGIFTDAERVRLRKLLVAGEGAQKRISDPAFDILEDVETGTDVLTQLLVRISGSKIGSMVGDLMPGRSSQGLIEAQAGSQAAMRLLNALPVTTVNSVLESAIKDPEYLDLLLDKNLLSPTGSKLSASKRLLGVRKLNAYLKNAVGVNIGAMIAEDQPTTSEMLRVEEFRQQGSPFRAPAPEPVAPPQAAAPMPALPPAPPPARPFQGGANPQQRQQFAALFPNDPISGLIQQQGIASLPQAPS